MNNFDISVRYFKEGNFQEALTQINICIEAEQHNNEFYFFRARVLSRMGNLQGAIDDFDYLISLEPYNPTFISDRAVVLHMLNRNEEAIQEFDRALNLEPGNPYRYSSRAFFKDRIGDLEGAIADYEKAIELDPEDAVAYNNKGLVEEKLGYRDRSKKSFEKADELVGYEPNRIERDDAFQKPSTPSDKKAEIQQTETGETKDSSKKINISTYFKTLKEVFTDKNTQKEFWAFLKSGLRNPKN